MNEMLFDTLSLLKMASADKMSDKARIIVDSFLNKSDFFSEQSKLFSKEDDEIEMKDCILAVDQLDRIITGEPETEMGTTEAPLALLFPEQELE